MPKYSPYTLQMQLTRMFQEGQSFFALNKVQDWLRERQEDPQAYEITFQRRSAPPTANSPGKFWIEVELRRRDGQPVDPWLLEEINR